MLILLTYAVKNSGYGYSATHTDIQPVKTVLTKDVSILFTFMVQITGIPLYLAVWKTMPISIRSYTPQDYPALVTLYKQGTLCGGHYDADRDSQEQLNAVTAHSPNAILVAERQGEICGTLSLSREIDVAWLFRFVIQPQEEDRVATALLDHACGMLKQEGRHQIQAYPPTGNKALQKRYERLGFSQANGDICLRKLLSNA